MSNLNPKYEREKWVIRRLEVEGPPDFELIGPKGETTEHVSRRPRLLAKIAWDKGAQEVVFDFDLNLDPDK